MVTIEKTGYPRIDFYRKVVALTEEMAPDHREYLSDGDLPADIEELYERVIEHIDDELLDGDYAMCWPPDKTGNIWPFDMAFYQGCLNYYVNGEPSVWEEDVNPVEEELYTAFEEAGIKTPYTI